MKFKFSSKVAGHLAMFGAVLMWGASAPIGKFILAGQTTPMLLTGCRVFGAAILFWLISFFVPAEKVNRKDMIAMFFAAMLGIMVNQSCFVIGLAYTSPINASIITTSLPIVTMVLAAAFLHEPITKMKCGGVLLGATGALILILRGHDTVSGSGIGDVIVLTAQCAFACYLVFFSRIISRYTPITLMKWMFTKLNYNTASSY